MAERRRVDVELVRRGLARSRDHAATLIADRKVLADGAFVEKPARLVDPGGPLELVAESDPYVSRAGAKLAGALARFEVHVARRRFIDVGSSTGGFTDCLLQHGASAVVAVDVGTAQLHERLRGDPRVTALERTDIRSLDGGDLGGALDGATVDVSFIGLARVLPAVFALLHDGAPVLALAKPQFEAGRAEADRGRGVITDPQVHRRVLAELNAAIPAVGGSIMDVMSSPVRGSSGNREFMLHIVVTHGTPMHLPAERLDAVVAGADDPGSV